MRVRDRPVHGPGESITSGRTGEVGSFPGAAPHVGLARTRHGRYAIATSRPRTRRHTMESIEGRVALVTGGGRGIGRAIALALAGAGADVAVAARTIPELEAVAAEIARLGRRTHFFPL